MDGDGSRTLYRYNDDKTLEYLPASIYIMVMVILGVTGNSFAIAFYKQKKKTTSTVLLLVLSVNDLLTSIVLSDIIITLCFTVTFTNLIGCQFIWFVNHTFVSNSLLFLLLLAVERFMLVYLNKRLTQMSIACLITAMVVVTLGLSIRDFWILDTVPVNITLDGNVTIVGHHCMHTKDAALQSKIKLFHLIDLIEWIGIFSAIFTLYMLNALKIYKSKKKLLSHKKPLNTVMVSVVSKMASSKGQTVDLSTGKDFQKLAKANRVTQQRTETRITQMVFAIIVASVASFVPYFMAHLLVPYRFDRPVWLHIVRRSFVLNSAINPYIIGYFNVEFRKYLVRKLACNIYRN